MLIAIDYETHLISSQHPWPKVVCMSVKDDKGVHLYVGYSDMNKRLYDILNSDDTVIAHNMSFEFNVTYTNFPHYRKRLLEKLEKGELVCTKVVQQLLDHQAKKGVLRYSLADLVMHYFQVDISAEKTDPEAWRLRYSELDGIPIEQWPERAIQYAKDDAEWAFNVYASQKPVKYTESVRAEALLNLMGKFGMLIDMDRVHTLESELKNMLTPMYQELALKGFAKPNKKNASGYSKNMKAVRQYLLDTMPEERLKWTPSGAVSTGKEDLLTYGDDPIVSTLTKIALYDKALSDYVCNLKEADPYIRTTYSATKATGRTSASTDRSMPSVNIQNMPRSVPDVTYDIRNCFKPREGYKICSIDYSGLELAATAHQLLRHFGHSRMAEIINQGDTPTDMHSFLGARFRTMAGKPCSYEEFAANRKLEGYKEFRKTAKPVGLSFPGGVGYDTMRYLMAKDNIITKFSIVERADAEWKLKQHWFQLRQEFDNIRIARLSKKEWAIVVDELVQLKAVLLDTYPELGQFLRVSHEKFQTGQDMFVKNEYGEWEKEPAYCYNIYGMKRDWATYTAFCNGYLMQTPAAIGAKRATCAVIQMFHEDERLNPLAFIHDEIVMEIKDCDDTEKLIEVVADKMITEMQTVLSSVRIAVEADLMGHWAKEGGQWLRQYWRSPGGELRSK